MSDRVRRLITALLAIVLGAGAALLVLIFFNARDDSTFVPAAGPGQALTDQGDRHIPQSQSGSVKYATDPPASGPHFPEPINTRDQRVLTDDQIIHALELGDVILFYGDKKPPKDLVALQRELSGPYDEVLTKAGQQVILARRPGTKGVLALAWARRLQVPDPEDPRVHEFADFWLGRGANEPAG